MAWTSFIERAFALLVTLRANTTCMEIVLLTASQQTRYRDGLRAIRLRMVMEIPDLLMVTALSLRDILR